MRCSTCEGFRLRDLLLESSSKVPSGDGTFDPIEKFYKHHAGITALKDSAALGCELCSFLHDTAAMKHAASGMGGNEEQIYFGLSGYNAKLTNLPCLTVKQFLPSGAVRAVGMYDMFVYRDSIPAEFAEVLGREVNADPSSDSCLAIASEWLEECLLRHKHCPCSGRESTALPTRVIDVGRPDGSQNPRLHITAGDHGQYAALSYVWGGDSDFILKGHTVEGFQAGISLDEFPTTLQDSIIVTRKLGLRYLWIDALCIIQDDKDDWAKESSRMRDVFKKAVVTVAAGDSVSTYDGFLNKPRVPIPNCRVNWSTSPGDENVRVMLRVMLRERSQSRVTPGSRLHTRGWTLQEALLAPRTLTFRTAQLYWECPSLRKSESGLSLQPLRDFWDKGFLQRMYVYTPSERGIMALPKRTSTQLARRLLNQPSAPSTSDISLRPLEGKRSPFDVYDRWFEIVREFSKRDLKYATDTFPALSGLAQDFQSLLHEDYCAGLWKRAMIKGLLWTREPYGSRGGQVDLASISDDAQNTYIAPSWSWAAIRGGLIFLELSLRQSNGMDTVAKCLDVKTIPSTADPFGELNDGYLTLRAPLHRVVDPRQSVWSPSDTSCPALQKTIHHSYENLQKFRAEFAQQHVETAGQHFAAALIVKWTEKPRMAFLLLESTERRPNEYRRVWMMYISKDEKIGAPGPVHDLIDEDRAAFDEVVAAKWKKAMFTIV